MTSDDMKTYLTTNKQVLDIIDSRYQDDPDIVASARKPEKWKRRAKYKVGSDSDGYGYDTVDKGRLKGGTVRIFDLLDSDGAAIGIVEKDGKVVYVDDLCD